jgi:multimeric flavodoxin WrbA
MVGERLKIIGVSGSTSRDGSTVHLLEHYLRGFGETGAETKIIHINDYNIRECTADMKCRDRSGNCLTLNDDVNDLLMQLVEADALVLGTPVHYGDTAAHLSTFIERTLPLRRADFKLKHKVGGIISTGHRRNGGSEASIKKGWEFFVRNQMLFIGGEESCPYGPIGWGDEQNPNHIDPISIEASFNYGRRAADLARRIKEGLKTHNLSYTYSSEGKLKEIKGRTAGDDPSKYRDKIRYNHLQNKVKVAGIYASELGLPRILIEEALSAASGMGAKVVLVEASDVESSIEAIKQSHAVLMASDSFYGGYNPKYANLFSRLQNEDLGIDEKLFAALSVAKQRNGGQENIIKQLWEVALRKKMVVLGGSSGSQYGVLGWDNGQDDFHAKLAASFLGQKITKLADIIYQSN